MRRRGSGVGAGGTGVGVGAPGRSARGPGPGAACPGATGPAAAEAALCRGVSSLTRRERVRRAAARAVRGAFWGLAAAAVLLAVSDAVRFPFPPAALAAAITAAGIAAAAAAATLRRAGPRALLIRLDAALSNGELTSTAWDMAERGARTAFTGAILEDALRALPGARRALRRPAPRLLPFVPLVAAAALALALFPVDLASLLARRAARPAELTLVGRNLEEQGRRLERQARARGEPRLLELSQELQRIGRDFQDERIDPSETRERLSGLERQLEGSGARLEPMDTPRVGSTPGKGEGTPGAGAGREAPGAEEPPAGTGDEGGREPGAGPGGRGSPPGEAGQPGDGEQRGGSAGRGGAGGGKGTGPGEPDAGSPGHGRGRSGSGGPSDYGTQPAPFTAGPPVPVRPAEGPLARTPGTTGQGDSAEFLLRALPGSGVPGRPEAELRRQYAREAEAAIAREEVPLPLRESVKGYFLSIGILKGE
jgi:hypothetical protein